MPSATVVQTEANPFIKQLASSNRKTRDAALDSLRTYLQRRTRFTELDLLKLWKGLFFCMWMSDKPLTQQRLARDLADLVHVLHGRENFLGFVKAFWATIAREWGGIDALRMDKFMYLVRCYVNRGFGVVGRNEWADENLLREYLEILEAVPLNPSDPKIPDGLRLHVLDVYVDELEKVDVKRTVPLDLVMEPVRTLGNNSLSKSVRARVKDTLANERLVDWKNVDTKNEDTEDEESEGVEQRPGLRTTEDQDMAENEDDFSGFDD